MKQAFFVGKLHDMNKRRFKDRVYNELTRITKSMANPHRLEIIDLIAQGKSSVERIAKQTGLSIANASQHLQVLKLAHLVETHRQGNTIYYTLSNNNVFVAWQGLRDLGIERNTAINEAVKQFRKSTSLKAIVTIDQLLGKLEKGSVSILDVRPESEYQQGHIANAISIPIDVLSDRLKELPRRKEIITYCRGPFCVYADEAVAILSQAGFRARRLQEGFPDWKVRQLPIEVSMN